MAAAALAFKGGVDHHPSLGQAYVGIAHYELDTSEATLLLLRRSLWLEGANEGLPEALAFAVTHL